MEHRRSQDCLINKLKIMQQQVGHEHASTTTIYIDPRFSHPHTAPEPGCHAGLSTDLGTGHWENTMKRRVAYHWRLRDIMADHGMFTTTELVPLLRERDLELSVSQVHRLVTGTPERLSLSVLAALCDIFERTPAELSTPRPPT